MQTSIYSKSSNQISASRLNTGMKTRIKPAGDPLSMLALTSREEESNGNSFLMPNKDGEITGSLVAAGTRSPALKKKKGGTPRGLSSFSVFNGFISLMGMHDIELQGHKYTWESNRQGEGYVEEQLDRVFCSLSWLTLYPNSTVQNESKSSSDHNQLCLNSSPVVRKAKKRFFFDNRWLKKDGISEVVSKAWNCYQSGTPMYCFQEKKSKELGCNCSNGAARV
ncbi:Unknown protein [Striga hermonthica]|uniref:Uncharacterized protein n=1 Tax=Striga hermonthica TaxID=68872 RepID=A0A9N7MP99_STRHE|nr:Unknown protein [Striga hermonthica]